MDNGIILNQYKQFILKYNSLNLYITIWTSVIIREIQYNTSNFNTLKYRKNTNVYMTIYLKNKHQDYKYLYLYCSYIT